MLQNAYFLAKIGADTAENEQHLAEILPKTGNGRRERRAAEDRKGTSAAHHHEQARGGLVLRVRTPVIER